MGLTKSNSPDEVSDIVERGLEALAAGNVEDSLRRCLEAREKAPNSIEHLYLMGLISMRLNRLMDAIDCMLEGHRLAPEVSEFSAALATLYASHGKLSDSLYYSKLVHAQKSHPLLSRFSPKAFSSPDTALGSVNLQGYFQDGYISYMAKDYLRAKEYCENNLRLEPNHAAGLQLYGRVLLELGLHREAAIAFGGALNSGETDPEVPALLSQALAGAGDFAQAVEVGREAVRLAPENWDVLGRIIQAWDTLPDEQFAARAAMVDLWRQRVEAVAEPMKRRAPESVMGRRLRIGYVINDFAAQHYVDQMEAVMEHHSDRIEVHAYQLFLSNPEALSRLRPKTRNWRELGDVDDYTAAAIIAGEGIDVLIDMCSMTPGARPEIIGQHPAPLQVSWLAGEASVAGIDYVLADPISRNALAAGTEVLELPGGVFCQPRGPMLVSIAEGIVPPAQTNGYVTYGATLDLPRIAPSAAVWARILQSDPSARLMLGNVPAISQDALVRVHDIFSQHGVAEQILVEDTAGDSGLEPFWGKVDILLTAVNSPDVFEIAHVLALGLPVVGRHGSRLAHARAVALFAQAGQDHWIASDDDNYVQIALSMGRTAEAAATLRKDLVGTIGFAPLCNIGNFTQSFEEVLTQAVVTASF